MIKQKEVIRMKVPYPSITDGMALSPHMYICRTASNEKYEYVKCQTLKPYMLISNPMKHYHDEDPDLERNPFKRTTRIDCDKLFLTYTVTYDAKLKTETRADVCDELFNIIEQKFSYNEYEKIDVNESNLKTLNSLICTRR